MRDAQVCICMHKVHVCVCVSVCVNQLHDIFNGKNTRSMAVAQKWIMLQFVARKVLGNW